MKSNANTTTVNGISVTSHKEAVIEGRYLSGDLDISHIVALVCDLMEKENYNQVHIELEGMTVLTCSITDGIYYLDTNKEDSADNGYYYSSPRLYAFLDAVELYIRNNEDKLDSENIVDVVGF